MFWFMKFVCVREPSAREGPDNFYFIRTLFFVMCAKKCTKIDKYKRHTYENERM